ncbi:unnamed protein product [Paramecium primaurelia]|uniref:Uncharacterized protein n=1 Tax=Paramecium primaurelia TaxID=5886 RepID=A0A8S1KVU6_PARPR|nr:unnamed protein product [Paramecium primaurelia]
MFFNFGYYLFDQAIPKNGVTSFAFKIIQLSNYCYIGIGMREIIQKIIMVEIMVLAMNPIQQIKIKVVIHTMKKIKMVNKYHLISQFMISQLKKLTFITDMQNGPKPTQNNYSIFKQIQLMIYTHVYGCVKVLEMVIKYKYQNNFNDIIISIFQTGYTIIKILLLIDENYSNQKLNNFNVIKLSNLTLWRDINYLTKFQPLTLFI